MTASDIVYNHKHYHQQVTAVWGPTLNKLSKVMHRFVLFHITFLIICMIQMAFFISQLRAFSQPIVLAFTLACFVLTVFSFLILRLYLLSRRGEIISDLVEDYLKRCKDMIHYQEGIPEHHMALANAAHKLAHHLQEKEYSFYAPPVWLKSLGPSLETFSCFCHWKDLFQIKETLMQTVIEEHTKVVKCEPTNLEVHAALANAYVNLSSLYADPSTDAHEQERWIPKERFSLDMQAKFRQTSERAIEEFKILNDYAPNDPWIYMQLAYSYHDLQMPEQEIQAYESLLRLNPDDQDILFKLGVLYFKQGKNAKGLRVYEQLKKYNFKKAEGLLKFYN